MVYHNLSIEFDKNILLLTINRELKLNALNQQTLAELNRCLVEAADNPDVRGLILTGSGTKAFAAGADIAEFINLNADQAREIAENGRAQVFDLLANFPKPVIAAVNGFALGGGLELAMACHIRIAAEHAQFGLPELSLGLIPGYGGTQRLSQLIGKGKAMELILTSDRITAQEALALGLVNQVTSPMQLLPEARLMMEKMLAKSSLALSAAIKAIQSSSSAQTDGFEVEISQFAQCFNTSDMREGVAAFMEKRTPIFKGG